MKKSKKVKNITTKEQLEVHIKTLVSGCKILKHPDMFDLSHYCPQFALSGIDPFCVTCGYEWCDDIEGLCKDRVFLTVNTICGLKECLNTEHFVIEEEVCEEDEC